METEVIHTTEKGKSILLFFPPYFELFRRIDGYRCISHTNSYNNAIITQCHVDGNQRAWATCANTTSPLNRLGSGITATAHFQIQIFIIMHYLQNIRRSIFTEITRNTKRKRLNNT